MKKLIIISLLGLLFSWNSSAADIPGALVNAFKSGNSAQVSVYFNSTIEMTINNKEEIYSKTQAEIILRDFFRSSQPIGFKILHQGGKENSKYAIGNLSTADNNYRITLLLKLSNNQFYIHQLHIEKDEVE